MALAINSLPVPLGPTIKIVDRRLAIRLIDCRIVLAQGELPTIMKTPAFPAATAFTDGQLLACGWEVGLAP